MMSEGYRRCCNGDRRDCRQQRLGIAEDVVVRGCCSLLVCIGMECGLSPCVVDRFWWA